MYQIVAAAPGWESSHHSPDSLAGFKGEGGKQRKGW